MALGSLRWRSLSKESSTSGSQTTTLQKGSEDVTMLGRLSKKRTAAFAGSRRALRNIKFGAGAGKDPFARRKGLTPCLCDRLKNMAYSEAAKQRSRKRVLKLLQVDPVRAAAVSFVSSRGCRRRFCVKPNINSYCDEETLTRSLKPMLRSTV